MLKKRKILTVLGAATLVLLLGNLPGHGSSKLKSLCRRAAAPIQSAVSGTVRRVKAGANAVRGLGGLMERNSELSEEVLRLQAAARSYEALEHENAALRRQLAFMRESSISLIPCQIIGRGISGWWENITLSKGRQQGVLPDRAIVSPDGLIGRTVNVGGFSAEALLISAPDCEVSARITRTGTFGIVRGMGCDLRGRPRCRMDFINKDVPVKIGDDVVTAGLGSVFPEGIRIGTIEKVETDRTGLYQSAEIIPHADLGMLEFVFVLTEKVTFAQPADPLAGFSQSQEPPE